MSEQESGKAIKLQVENSPVPEKIVEEVRNESDPESPAKKVKDSDKPKDPKLNLLFFSGFVGTLLVGSFHYGSLWKLS